MTRKKQINKAAEQFLADRPKEYFHTMHEENTAHTGFVMGAKWADAHPENQWISVKERLPKKWKRIKVLQGLGEECWAYVSKTVLVNADGWGDTPKSAFYDFDAKIWWSEFGDDIENIFGTPEYWMPLPKLPKGGTQ